MNRKFILSRKGFIFKYLLILLFFSLNTTCRAKQSEAEKEISKPKNYFSEDWIKERLFKIDLDSAKQKLAKQTSDEFLQKGILLYKVKQDLEAIKQYEAAIDSYPTGEIYYNYGNSLANLNRLEDSIQAYEISLRLKTKRPELVAYNIACSYSRLGKVYEAYSHLADSIDLGYNAFAHIETDPDMKNLRQEPDWKEKINSLILSSKYKEEDFFGQLVQLNYMIYYTAYFYLCRSKEVLIVDSIESIDCLSYRLPGFKRGKWKFENGKIAIRIYSYCRSKNVPDLEALESTKYKNCYGYKKKFIYKECESVDYEDEISRFDIKLSLEKKLFFKLSPEQEPKQCDPNFIPQTLEDLYVNAKGGIL